MEVLSIPSNKVEIELSGRIYGSSTQTTTAKLLQPKLEVFDTLRQQLCDQSQLLKLTTDANLTREQVFEAYKYDLKLLESRVYSFENCLKKAVYLSFGTKPENLVAASDKWRTIREQIPQLARVPLLALNFVRAAKETPQLVAELQDEFSRGIDRVINLFSLWLQLLVDNECIGIIEWSASDVCRYHYFKQVDESKVLTSSTAISHSYDSSRDFGSRNENTTTLHQTVHQKCFLERHIHHVVACKLYSLKEYRNRKPKRVKEFLKHIPIWLEPLLKIVDGQITMEEIVRRKTIDEIVATEEVISVYKYSPGILLGNFNLVGWSADDLPEKISSIVKEMLLISSSIAFGVAGIAQVIQWLVAIYNLF